MEVDDVPLLTAQDQRPTENGGGRTQRHQQQRRSAVTVATAAAKTDVGATLQGGPPEMDTPESDFPGEHETLDESVLSAVSDVNDGETEANDTDNAAHSSATPLKLELSATEDEDSHDIPSETRTEDSVATSNDHQMMFSPNVEEEKSNLNVSTLKRKRYEVRRSGSEECLLGFDEQSGEAELVKDDTGMVYGGAAKKKVEAALSHNAAKKMKSSSTTPTPHKNSPKNATSENAVEKRSSDEKSKIKDEGHDQQKQQQPQQEHIVADNEEINGSTIGSNSSAANANAATTTATVKTTPPSAASVLTAKKPSSAHDDFYKKPFEYGWKRELVWRANMETSKDKADVYFITPTGKKLRTRSDIIPLLEGELTIDHFSFAREPLGVGSEYEIVRSAKPSSRVSITAATLASAPAPTNIGKRISKPKGPKGASPPPQGWTPTRALKVNNAALLSSTSSSRYSGGSSNPGTPPSRSSSTVGSHRSSKSKKHVNDIENDLKQINESIRNSRKPSSASLDAALQCHNATGTATATLTDNSHKLFATNFFANVSFAYDALLCILKYLKIHERPRAAAVCKLWNLAAKDTSLWHTVRMKNSKVSDWGGFASALRRGETKHLDLRKMLVASTRSDEMWQAFSEHIGTVCSLEVIDLCRCSSKVVENLFESNKNLRVLNAVTINDDSINLENIGLLTRLEELRLRTCEPGLITGDLQTLENLKNLTQLSITGIRGLGSKGVHVLKELAGLHSLELGECGDFDTTFATMVLPNLKQLQRLRLENGQETSCCTLEILDAVSQLKQLSQLELVNFDIKTGFDDKLNECRNIRKLLIIPTYISQSATTNHIVLNAVQQVADTLQVFTWGVTVELLRVTALYVDQCEESTKKEKHHFDECIPVLKPVPGELSADDNEDECTEKEKDDSVPNDVPQIEILPLDKVESILGDNLPRTKFTIVKVPYHVTCKQQLVE